MLIWGDHSWGDDDNATATRTGLQFLEPWRDNVVEYGEGSWSTDALGRPGTLAMWPGPLNHSVPVHEGPHQRISLAFNLALTMK